MSRPGSRGLVVSLLLVLLLSHQGAVSSVAAAVSSSCMDILRTRYNVEREPFNRGLEGRIYRATDKEYTGAGYKAIKVKPLPGKDESNPEALILESPENESIILSQLSPHQSIVRYYEHVATEQDVCLVEEYVDGITLSQFLERDIPISVEQLVALLRSTNLAIGHLHTQGVAHNDLNAGSLMVSSKGVLKVVDFGMASRGPPDKDLEAIAALIPLLYGPAFRTVPELHELYRNLHAPLGQPSGQQLSDLFEQVDYDDFPFRVHGLPAQSSEYERGFLEVSEAGGDLGELPLDISLISRVDQSDGEFKAAAMVLTAEGDKGYLVRPLQMVTRQRFHWVVFSRTANLVPAGRIHQAGAADYILACARGALDYLHSLGLSFCSPHVRCTILPSLYYNSWLRTFQLRPHAVAPVSLDQTEPAPSFERDEIAFMELKQELAAK